MNNFILFVLILMLLCIRSLITLFTDNPHNALTIAIMLLNKTRYVL